MRRRNSKVSKLDQWSRQSIKARVPQVSALVVSSKWTFKTACEESSLMWIIQGKKRIWETKNVGHEKKIRITNIDFYFTLYYSCFMCLSLTHSGLSRMINAIMGKKVFQFHGQISKVEFHMWLANMTLSVFKKGRLFNKVHLKSIFVAWLSTTGHLILLPSTKNIKPGIILAWLAKINTISCVNAGDWIEPNIKTLALSSPAGERKVIIRRKTVGGYWSNPTNRVLPPWRI